jgi:hypothetical protein
MNYFFRLFRCLIHIDIDNLLNIIYINSNLIQPDIWSIFTLAVYTVALMPYYDIYISPHILPDPSVFEVLAEVESNPDDEGYDSSGFESDISDGQRYLEQV